MQCTPYSLQVLSSTQCLTILPIEEYSMQVLLQSLLVSFQGVAGDSFPLLGAATWVSNHTCGPTNLDTMNSNHPFPFLGAATRVSNHTPVTPTTWTANHPFVCPSSSSWTQTIPSQSMVWPLCGPTAAFGNIDKLAKIVFVRLSLPTTRSYL